MSGIIKQMGAGGLSQLAGALGVDEGAAGEAIGMALPALLGGMARNTAQPEGAQALASALDSHDESVFSKITDLIGSEDGQKILGHVLGNKQEATAQRIAGGSGLDLGSVMKLLPALAPLVMGFLSKQKQSNNLGPDDLSAALAGERQNIESKAPGLGGLASILDTDGDGLDLGDLTKLAGGSGGLGGLLGNILKG